MALAQRAPLGGLTVAAAVDAAAGCLIRDAAALGPLGVECAAAAETLRGALEVRAPLVIGSAPVGGLATKLDPEEGNAHWDLIVTGERRTRVTATDLAGTFAACRGGDAGADVEATTAQALPHAVAVTAAVWIKATVLATNRRAKLDLCRVRPFVGHLDERQGVLRSPTQREGSWSC